MEFFFGLIIGSFLNVLIYRLNSPKAPKWWQGRSLCPGCKHQILWFDNIPLLSFVMLRGRCRHCRALISWQYPIVELLTAAVFVFVGFNPPLLIITCAFVVIFFSDWIYGLIPDEMIILGSFASAFFIFHFSVFILGEHLLTGIVSGLVFFLIVLVTKFRGMGLGDVKLAFLIGFLLGWPGALVTFWLSFLLGGIIAIGLVLLKKVRLSDKIAFGPYLVLGTLFSALWSNELLRILGF